MNPFPELERIANAAAPTGLQSSTPEGPTRVGDDFIHDGLAWRSTTAPFSAGSAAGLVVLAQRLHWNPVEGLAQWSEEAFTARGSSSAIPVEGSALADFKDVDVFDPNDPDGEHYGMFDHAAE